MPRYRASDFAVPVGEERRFVVVAALALSAERGEHAAVVAPGFDAVRARIEAQVGRAMGEGVLDDLLPYLVDGANGVTESWGPIVFVSAPDALMAARRHLAEKRPDLKA